MKSIGARTSAEQIIALERGALDRWGNGDPGGFLDLYGADITYFDPVTARRIDGHQAMEDYYSSPAAAEDKVILVSEAGKVTVLKA